MSRLVHVHVVVVLVAAVLQVVSYGDGGGVNLLGHALRGSRALGLDMRCHQQSHIALRYRDHIPRIIYTRTHTATAWSQSQSSLSCN